MHSIIYNSIIYNRALTPPSTHTLTYVWTHTHMCVLGLLFLVTFFLRDVRIRVRGKPKKFKKKGEGPTPFGGGTKPGKAWR